MRIKAVVSGVSFFVLGMALAEQTEAAPTESVYKGLLKAERAADDLDSFRIGGLMDASYPFVNAGRPEVLILDPAQFSFETDGSARGLPESQTSQILAVSKDGNLVIDAEIRGLMGASGSVGFAIARQEFSRGALRLPSLDEDGDLFGIQFHARSGARRRWRLVLETDVSRKLSRDGMKVTYEAEFEASPVLSGVTLRLSDFRPVTRGQVRNDLPALTCSEDPANQLSLLSVAFEATRGTVEGGRENLAPIRADLTVEKKSLAFGFLF